MSLAHWLRSALTHRWLPLWLAFTACLLLSPALRGGFQLDDHFQRFRLLGYDGPAIQLFVFADGDVRKNALAIDSGQLPWWAAPGFRHASLRYLSVLTMQLDFALWPDRPQWMHLHSVLWLGTLVASAALAGAPTAMEITRIEPSALRVRLTSGLFNVPFTRYFRAPELHFAVADRIDLTGFSIEIAGLNAAGDPSDLIFRFGVPLENPRLRWLAWSDGAYVPWQPPAIGASTQLPAPKGIFE